MYKLPKTVNPEVSSEKMQIIEDDGQDMGINLECQETFRLKMRQSATGHQYEVQIELMMKTGKRKIIGIFHIGMDES